MNPKLTYRKARLADLNKIVELLLNDDLGKTREIPVEASNSQYVNAFQKIDADPNQFLMIIELNSEIVGTCHLTLMPSLTFTGSTRLQIEAVRVSEQHRGLGIGEWMIQKAIEYGKSEGVSIIQLSTNKKREKAKKFYEKLGFQASHEGMKLYI